MYALSALAYIIIIMTDQKESPIRYLPIGDVAWTFSDESGRKVAVRRRDNIRLYPIETQEIFHTLMKGPTFSEFEEVTEKSGFPAAPLLEKFLEDEEIVAFPSSDLWSLKFVFKAVVLGKVEGTNRTKFVSQEDFIFEMDNFSAAIAATTGDEASLGDVVVSLAKEIGVEEEDLAQIFLTDLLTAILAGGGFLELRA